jgi:prepilin-type N-terminal cleavage/methylation domain-containing protein
MQPVSGVLASVRRRASGQSGFTLIELVVAMAMGIVVMFALSYIMIAMLQQSQRTFTRVDATRQARVALNTIDNELHSACVDGSAPIQPGSTGTNVIFLTYSGNAANPTPVWHQLTFSGGTLIDYRYDVTANPTYTATGTGPEYQRGAALSPASVTLLSNASQQTKAGSPVDVFQYFRYASAGTDSSGDTYYTVPDGTSVNPLTGATITAAPLTASGTGLSQDDAANTVEVLISVVAGATSENINKASIETDSVADAISLRLTTPPNYLPAGKSVTGYGPCE